MIKESFGFGVEVLIVIMLSFLLILKLIKLFICFFIGVLILFRMSLNIFDFCSVKFGIVLCLNRKLMGILGLRFFGLWL